MKTFKRYYILLIGALLLPLFLWADIPPGYYYEAAGKKQRELKTALHQLAYPVQTLKYGSGEGATWEGFFATDQATDGSVLDRYSSIVRYFNGFSGVEGMHIEHSLPKSWWGGTNNPAYRDLFHLYPSDGTTNSRKNNFPLGEIYVTPNFDNGISKVGTNGFGNVYSGLAFEPADEYKGDFARSYLYIATIYEDLAPLWNSPMMEKNSYPVWNPWAIELLLQWHTNDPVSFVETRRQEAVFNIQGNRNPFIDYPDLVNYIWGKDTLSAFPFPEETMPFLISPRNGDRLDFEVILSGDTLAKALFLRGINMTSSPVFELTTQQGFFTIHPPAYDIQQLSTGFNLPLVFRPLHAGTFRDTLIISGGGLSTPMRIPIVGKASNAFLALEADEINPAGARLQWIADPDAEDYLITINEGTTKAGNLIISAYIEGSGFNKAIEVFNGTGTTIDLSDYTLLRQSNGVGDFVTPFTLNGMLANGTTHLVAHRSSTNADFKAMAQQLTDSVLNFNGNDAVALAHQGIFIDMAGFADGGEALFWGTDKTLKRRAYVTHPTTQYQESQWLSFPIDDFSPLGSHHMIFQEAEIPFVTQLSSNGMPRIEITGLTPETTYNYFVERILGNVHDQSVNSVQFTTAPLDAPIALDALDVTAFSFLANWEDDPYTNNFLLSVYQLTGNADTTELEAFNSVGSSGKPLPEGWTGTVSGNYTTTASSGANPPSLALRNTGEFVQTKTYPYPVTQFGFMYRFPSGAGASYLTVEGMLPSGDWMRIDSIPYVNTSKYYMNYNFSRAKGLTAFKITYALKASSANLAIDDVTVVYGNQEEIFLFRDQPVTGNAYSVRDLESDRTYYYRVRATLNSKFSPDSEPIEVRTEKVSANPEISKPPIYSQQAGGLRLMRLKGDETIRLYSIAGQLLHSGVANSPEYFVPVNVQQMLILQVIHRQGSHSFKLMPF